MSISMIVLEPKSREYSQINIPLATDDVFNRIWLPGAEKTDARWLSLFRSGIDIDADDFVDVSQELIALREWIKSHKLDNDEKNQVISRIDLLICELGRLSSESGGKIKVFIG